MQRTSYFLIRNSLVVRFRQLELGINTKTILGHGCVLEFMEPGRDIKTQRTLSLELLTPK